jgi:hypothetical protein
MESCNLPSCALYRGHLSSSIMQRFPALHAFERDRSIFSRKYNNNTVRLQDVLIQSDNINSKVGNHVAQAEAVLWVVCE